MVANTFLISFSFLCLLPPAKGRFHHTLLLVKINENQGNHYGYKNTKQEVRIRASHLDQYYPSSAAWRSEVMEQGRDMLQLVLQTYPGVK